MQATKADFLALSTFEVGLFRWRRSCSWSSGTPRALAYGDPPS